MPLLTRCMAKELKPNAKRNPMNPQAIFEPLETRQLMSVSLGTNLVLNGDAEIPPTGMIVGWDLREGFTFVKYGEPDFPSATSPGPEGRGKWFFAGGGSNRFSYATQKIDLSPLAADIDAGRIEFNFSAWLGGYASQQDGMLASVIF